MPTFKRDDVSIYYEEYGSGFPILLFAPGGMRSNIEFWANSPFDPTKELAANFRVIAMDQRNAGKSSGPITAGDGWDTYTGDHIALLDHLGIKQCHLMGGCIGSSYSLGVIKAAPDRVSAAILQNPIGLSPRNREMFFRMFDTWADALKIDRPKLTDAALRQFRDRMYAGDFVFNVSREFRAHVQDASDDSLRQRRLSSDRNLEGNSRARTKRRTGRELEGARGDRRDGETRARISDLAHAKELAGELQLQPIGESGESLDASADCIAEHRFVADDDDRSPAAADRSVDELPGQHRDRFLG